MLILSFVKVYIYFFPPIKYKTDLFVNFRIVKYMPQENDVITLATALQLISLKLDAEPTNQCTSHYFKDKLLLLRHGERLDHVDRT